MSKLFSKLARTIITVVLAVVLVAATVVGIIFGFNPDATVADGKKVTVTVDSVLYQAEGSKKEIKKVCDDALDGALYFIDGDNGDSGEFVYAFKADANVEKAVEKLQTTFADWTKDGGKYESLTITVTETQEKVVNNLPEFFVLRGAIAATVFAVLAFAYAAFRYNWRRGLVAGIAVAVSMLLTGAIVILTRVPVTTSVLYAILTAGLLTAITVLFSLNKLRETEKSEEAPTDPAELVISSIAWKETIIFAAILGVAILACGIPAGASGAWFAVSAFIGLIVAAFMGLIYVPALCVPVQQAIKLKAESATKHGYKGAKKGGKRVKAEPQKEEVKEEPAPVEEAPVEEATEETPVEEVEEELSEEEIADLATDLDELDVE